MKSTLAAFFSYLFLATSFTAIISFFAILLIIVRYLFGVATEKESEYAYILFIVLVACLFIIPVTLFLSDKLGKSYKEVDTEEF